MLKTPIATVSPTSWRRRSSPHRYLYVSTTFSSASALILAVVAIMVGMTSLAYHPGVPLTIMADAAESISPEVCESIPGRKALNISSHSFCVPDCDNDEICAELQMPIFPNGSTPLTAGTIGKTCFGFPTPREGVCIPKNLTVQPVTSLGTTMFMSIDGNSMIDLGMHCFDAPPGTTAISTKCGAGKISRSLCRGFASITYSLTTYPTLTALHEQCGIDLTALVQGGMPAPCGCTSYYDVGVPTVGTSFATTFVAPNTLMYRGSLLDNKVCLPSPQFVDTDNGCPGGHTWQLNTAPLGYYCALKTTNGDSTLDAVSTSHCPDGLRLISVCGNTSNMHIMKGSYYSHYGVPKAYHCAPTPPTWNYAHAPGWVMPQQLTALMSDGSAYDPQPPKVAYTEFVNAAMPSTTPSTSFAYFIGSGCAVGAVCMPLPSTALIRDYRCGPGHTCRTNPCAAESYCPANLYDPATNTCGGSCVTACDGGLTCIRSVYDNETDYGCANGQICLPPSNPCPEYSVCQRVFAFAPVPDTRCPTGMICGHACPYGNFNCTVSGTGSAYGCPSGMKCEHIKNCVYPQTPISASTCTDTCTTGTCRPAMVADLITADYKSRCPTGHVCSTCGFGFTCGDWDPGRTGSGHCELASHPEVECTPVCVSGLECLPDDGGASTPGCPTGYTCQARVCEDPFTCMLISPSARYDENSHAGFGDVFAFAPCKTPYSACALRTVEAEAFTAITLPLHASRSSHCNAMSSPNFLSLLCPTFMGYTEFDAVVDCTSPRSMPVITTGLTCLACPPDQHCQYDPIGKGNTQYMCSTVGYRCISDLGALTQTFVCDAGYRCVDDGLPGTHNTSCPAEQVCESVCPWGLKCEADPESLTDIGCGVGFSCQKAKRYPCPDGGYCVSNFQTGGGYSDTNCYEHGHRCVPCPPDYKCEGGGEQLYCLCVHVCGIGYECLDDGISGTQSTGCALEAVCVSVCPDGLICIEGNITGLAVPGCSGSSTCLIAPPTTTPTTTTTLPPATTLPPTVQTYFGYGTYKTRYPDYTPTPLTGDVTTLPLLYSSTYGNSLFAMRFQVSDIFNPSLRLGINTTANQPYTTRLSITKTTRASSFDGIYLDSTVCSEFIGNASSTSDCGAHMTCSGSSTTTASGTHLGDSVSIRANAGALTATCGSSVRLSGVVYSTAPITQRVFQSSALLSSNPSHANIASTAAATAFVSTPSQWRGSSSASVVGVSGTSTVYLVGDATNPSGASAPIAERHMAPIATDSVDLTSSGGTTSFCALPDQSAYSASFVGANATIANGGVPTLCFTFDTVDSLHAACDAANGCVGFSTVRVNHRELPLCLYQAGTNLQPTVYLYDRVYYRKPQEGQSCSVGVQQSGRIAVYVQQTSFGSSQAVVRVDGAVKAVCGGSQPFSNGFAGKSGRCQLYALCYAGAVSADATVVVAIQGVLAQNGCNNTLGVLVSQVSVDATQVAATTTAPIERLTLPNSVGRVVRLPSGATDIRTLPLFVFGSSSAALDVAQTGFDCSLGGCESSSITMRTAGTCQRCGGSTGFFRNGRAGMSDQCETGLFCGSNISLRAGSSDVSACEAPSTAPSATPYTGNIRVTVDPTTLRARTSLCTDFNATLYAVTSSSVGVPVYPLLGANNTGFRTLLTAPSTLAFIDAAAFAAQRSGLTSSSLTPLFTVGPFGSQYTAFYADTLGTTPQATLHVNSTLACVVDHNAGVSSKCVFPIPQGSLIMRVLVAQNDYSQDANQLSVSVLSGSSVRTSVRCGGSQRFGRQSGAQELCSDYRVCTSRYLYDDDALATTATDGLVTVEVPSHIRPRGCNFTASIIVEFTRPAEVVPYSCSTYECPGERKCLPYSSVCDSVQDCSSNADEGWCNPWRPLDDDFAFCVPSQYTTNYTGKAYTDCRRLAAINTTSVFALIGTTCVVYSSSISATILASPTDYLCPVAGAVAHVRLEDEAAATFSLCTSSIQCGGNGVASSNTSGAGACTCTCIAGYTGVTCSERMSLSNIKTMIVVLQTTPNASIQVNLATLGEVLALNSTTVTVGCDSILPSPLSTSEVYVECIVTSTGGVPADEYIHQRRLLSPDIWSVASAALALNSAPGIAYITARTTMQPVLQMDECTGVSCTNKRPFDAVRIVSLAATTLQSVTLDISDTTAGGSSRGSRRVVSCVPTSTDVGGGCVASACDIFTAGTTTDNITISATTFAASDVTTGTCTSTSMSLRSHERFGDIATSTNETVINSETNYSWFLVGAILLFTAGWLASAVLFIVMWCVHRRRMREFTRMVKVEAVNNMTPAEHLKATLLSRLAYIRSTVVHSRIRPDRIGLVFAAMAILCGVAASFLTIYYATAYDRDSNFRVMYEEYTDSLCSVSPTASMPRRIFSVPRESTQCTKMSVTGETAGVVYADGRCQGSDGTYSAILQTGGAFLPCMEATETIVTSGTCLSAATLNPSDTRDIYVQLSCSTDAQISERTATLSALTTVADVFVDAPLTTLNSDLQFASRNGGPPTATVNGRIIHQFPFLSGGNIKVSTSTSEMTVSSTASKAQFDGQFDASRVVLQQFPDSFRNANVLTFVAKESDALPLMGDLDSADTIANMRPGDGDYGVGYTFGGFGTSSELTWQGAGPLAHRHYDVKGTNFDVAYHLPPTIDEMEDGSGFSISMYLRASNTTKGFAFAVTDAFENTQAGTVYTLDRLAEMIENGQASSAWFSSTYRVYSSLYVNGPSKQLTFAHADPSEAERVELMDWDLDRIGAGHLFNGLWHHVAVVYRVENGKLKATLVVDGDTSYSSEGWSVCADRIPPRVASFSNGTAPVFDISTDKATEGGVLVVGYLNGGVYGLTVTPREVLNTDYLGSGTPAMREHNAFPRVKTLVLGAIMTALGTAALLFVVIVGCIDVRKLRRESQFSEGRQAMVAFLTLQHTVTTANTLFEVNIDSSTLAPTPIRLSTAIRWTGLALNQFATIPAELVAQTQRPGEQLLLTLYNTRARTSHTSITALEWNVLVQRDVDEREASRTMCCMKHLPDATKDMQLLSEGSSDLFVEMAYKPSHTTKCGDFSDDDAEEDDADHRGGADGAAEITSIELGSGGGGGAADGVLKSLVDVLAPMIVVFQSMFVWSSSLHFPSLYDDYFSEIFSFVSIDVAMTFPGIPSIATPLAQMFLGFIIVVVVIYFVFEDHRRFESSLVQYVWRRDALETQGKESRKLHDALPTELTSVLVDTTVPEPMVELTTLPVGDCRTLDLMTGRIPKVHSEDTTDYTSMVRTTVTSVEGIEFTILRDTKDQKRLTVDDATSPQNSSKPLERAGCHCWRHPDVPLTPVEQTDIYPFTNPSSCCCVVNGQLCGVQVGTIFTCGERHTNDDGVEVVCTFGLCAAHCRLSLKDTIIAQIYGAKRTLATNGVGWILAVGVIFAVNTIYTPFLKTALMILACHPYYQCEFELCWTFMTQKFALAAFLSGSVVLVLGIGFPALLLTQLYRRRAALNVVFFGAEYGDRYVTPETCGPEFDVDSMLLNRKDLSRAEWSRFATADNSALAIQYGDASYRWLMMPAVALVFKVAVLIPAVFLEPRSWDQRLGSSAVEVLIAIFYFATNTQLSPILLITIRVASVHQLLILGLQNVDLVTEFDSALSLSMALVGITLAYVAFSVIVFVLTVAYPLFKSRSDKKQAQKFLNHHGFDYSSGISLYLEPNAQCEVDDLDNVPTMAAIPRRKSILRTVSGDMMVRSESTGSEAFGQPRQRSFTSNAQPAFDDVQSMGSAVSSSELCPAESAVFAVKRRRSSAVGGALIGVPTQTAFVHVASLNGSRDPSGGMGSMVWTDSSPPLGTPQRQPSDNSPRSTDLPLSPQQRVPRKRRVSIAAPEDDEGGMMGVDRSYSIASLQSE